MRRGVNARKWHREIDRKDKRDEKRAEKARKRKEAVGHGEPEPDVRT